MCIGDQALVAKLAAELQLENDMVEFQEMPESVKTFLESGGFEVYDQVPPA